MAIYPTSSGITSEFGYVYQRKVFLNILIKQCFNVDDAFTYEGIDDVSYTIGRPDLLNSIRFKKTAIQCKTGDLPYCDFLKAFENWVLIDELQEEYLLYSEKELSFNYSLETIIEDIHRNLFDYFNNHKKKSRKAILNRILKRFHFKDGKPIDNSLSEKVTAIFRRFKPNSIEYEALIADTSEFWIKNRIRDCPENLSICERRLDLFASRINNLIDNNESKRVSTTVSYATFEEMFQKVLLEINEDTPYSIDYVSFKKDKFNKIILDDRIMKSREGIFLSKVFNNDNVRVVGHLINECYYRDLRTHYIRQSENDKIAYAEEAAFENYQGARPDNDLWVYFDSVTRKDIGSSIIVNNQYRVGCYVFLSSDDCPEDVFIDWGGTNGK